MSKNLTFKEALKKEIANFIEEDHLMPSPKLGEPHYLDLEDEEIPTGDTSLQYDILVGNPASDVDDYVDHINEACGCSASGNDQNYNFIPDSMEGQTLFDKISDIAHDTLEDVGYSDKHHKSGAYMSKSQLYKIQKYARQLYEMIPDNYDLEDWMRSKISEMSDDIGEVYHAIDHRKFKGKI